MAREMLVEDVVSQAEEAMDEGQVLVFDEDGAFNKSWRPAMLAGLAESVCQCIRVFVSPS